MFNAVMGVIMIAIGVLSLVKGFFSKQMAGFIFFGVLMIGFGIVEIVRSKKVREEKKCKRNRELDMYTLIASQTGVKINPLTGEVIKPKESDKDNDIQPETQQETDVQSEADVQLEADV
jgi:uncharacterized membrane protein HdeD (DUF308 family)